MRAGNKGIIPGHALIAVGVFLFCATGARSQCSDNNSQTGGTITPTCPGTYSPAPCVAGGEYVRINVTSGNTYTFSTCGGAAFNTNMTIYTTGGTLVANNNDACGTQSAITWTAPWTAQIKVLLDRGGNCRTSNSCTPLYISCATAAPANDLICNASTLSVGANCVNLSPSPTNMLATTTAGPPAPGCANYSGGDVWFKFVVPSGGRVTVNSSSISSSPLLDLGLAAYSSSNNTCSGTLTLLACNDDINFPYDRMSTLDLTGLTVGNTIFIRAWENGNDAFGPFDICATILPTLPNEPCTSTAIPVGTECDYQNCTNVAATRSTTVGSPSCGGWDASGSAQSADVWYTFVAPANGRVVIQSNIGTMTDGAMALYSSNTGLCTGPFTQLVCDDDGGSGYMPLIVQTGLTPGTTYWLRFWGYGTATGTFQLCIFSPTGSRPEDCLGGYTLCDDQQVANNSQYTGFVSDLTLTNRGCLASSEKQGTWYIFTVSAAGNLGLTIDPIADDDYDWAIWGPYSSGSTTGSACVPSTVPIRCSYASGPDTYTATGSYNTGMGHATYTPPQWAAASTCGTCTQGATSNGWVSGIAVTVGQTYLMYISNFSQTGSAFNLDWNMQNGASLACTILPVELLALSAKAADQSVTVTWTSLSEHNSALYILERSGDGQTFQPIGTVEAAGESQHRIDYVYSDLMPLQGANYYRLKQIDLDGAYEHTPAVVVFFGKETAEPTVFPNPATDVVHVAFDMPMRGTAYLQVVDVNGKVVRDSDLDLDSGPGTVGLRIQDLDAGTYNVRITTTVNGGLQHARFIKQ